MPNTSSPILIADAGSTKTDWAVLAPDGGVSLISTQGINPFMLSAAQISGILQTELLPGMPGIAPSAVHFYGAGCAGAGIAVVEEALRGLFSAAELHVASDLLGAARALCGHGDGIACILGTGSNSCLYLDGAIRANVSPLGFILGDEGSGAVLGRRLVGDVLKRQLPETLCQDFEKEYQLTAADIIQRVYRSPLPNRFLASFAPFLSRHRYEPAVQALLEEEFARFFRRNVCAYRRPDLPVHFAGSIARHFQAEVFAAARSLGLQPGRVEAAPMEALVRYHLDRTDAYLMKR